MADVVDPATRSRMMSGIRGKNTKPEMLIRKALHARGFRYRLHCKDLPGNPDLCLPKYRAAIFVHGCFWHGHGCHLFKWPKTRPEFWREKIGRNCEVDEAASTMLLDAGWRVATVWECSLKGRGRQQLSEIAERLDRWLLSDINQINVVGDDHHGALVILPRKP
ncbi:very short patch repair endonuclease [Brevundimonas sp.]|uniref:very short patch repair endonuclease n=1 Tax=Brevundimonas sp. TaxID=1871086 RepID=UPI002D3F1FD0|nr:very short patch repair endonuclease [Brevundimonas sp.]HYC74313.1 very short patch repair endonuclease [Brevundimonas sp.]